MRREQDIQALRSELDVMVSNKMDLTHHVRNLEKTLKCSEDQISHMIDVSVLHSTERKLQLQSAYFVSVETSIHELEAEIQNSADVYKEFIQRVQKVYLFDSTLIFV